ncbi:hypothetical protein DDZ18_13415 [Marinicauda salina]|uniref:Uncharacterized protein n=2 Tax=Marinicauda salina TaxID=2135793 RepID=A0A2U2BQY1_9PROT|nr:hypothetical protein DDZ18_13415 [Marinicauda salina]
MFLTVAGAMLALAACSRAPEDRIFAACTQDETASEEECRCLSDGLAAELSDESLEAVADSIEEAARSDGQGGEAMNELGMETVMTVTMTAKNCGMAQ